MDEEEVVDGPPRYSEERRADSAPKEVFVIMEASPLLGEDEEDAVAENADAVRPAVSECGC